MNLSHRREIKSRSKQWAKLTSAFFIKTSITPNMISLASIIFAAIGAFLFIFHQTPFGYFCCACSIQGRLICNLLDGMVAIEGGKKTVLGDIYNEFPDRIADSLLIVSLGYSVNLPSLGWLAALLAFMTAYIRVFGGSLGLVQRFQGPMAKQHRMAVMTLACLLAGPEQILYSTNHSLKLALILICCGSVITCIKRTASLASELQSR